MWYPNLAELLEEAAATGNPMAKARSLAQFQNAFSDEASCAAFLFELRLAGRLCLP
jgi:hypothetical protein